MGFPNLGAAGALQQQHIISPCDYFWAAEVSPGHREHVPQPRVTVTPGGEKVPRQSFQSWEVWATAGAVVAEWKFRTIIRTVTSARAFSAAKEDLHLPATLIRP